MKKRLTKELNNAKDNFVVLTILPRDNYHELNHHMIKHMIKSKKNGAYVAINRPYRTIIEALNKEGIDHSKLFFIDCVSTKNDSMAENCAFIKSAKSLTNIGIALEQIYKKGQHSFVLLDSIDALSLYHEPEMIVRFARSLVSRIRDEKLCGLMIGLQEDTDKRIINEIAVVCDKVIDLSK
ncbi:MAG: ATPase domain-containing protein [Nanoarchaeota archaeon]